jgi:hypothetical protein
VTVNITATLPDDNGETTSSQHDQYFNLDGTVDYDTWTLISGNITHVATYTLDYTKTDNATNATGTWYNVTTTITYDDASATSTSKTVNDVT